MSPSAGNTKGGGAAQLSSNQVPDMPEEIKWASYEDAAKGGGIHHEKCKCGNCEEYREMLAEENRKYPTADCGASA